MLVHKEEGGAHPTDPMAAMTKAFHYDPASLLFLCLGLEVAATHCFVFQEMMSGTKNILRLDDKHVEQIVTVACKSGGGVASVPVTKLDEWNFKLLVYYVKLCEPRIRPVVLADINNNDLRSIEYHQNFMTLHDNAENSPPVITQT